MLVDRPNRRLAATCARCAIPEWEEITSLVLPNAANRDPTPPQLAMFRNRLAGVAATYLRASEPEYSGRVLQAGLPQSDDQEKSLGRASERFTRFRELLTMTMDVEVGIERLNAATRIACVRPPDKLLASIDTTYGAWIDSQIGNASISMMALFERTEALLKQAHRRLIVPFDNTAPRESSLLATLREYSVPLKALRDPYAHPGGAAQWVAETGRLEQHVLHGTWPAIGSIISRH